MTDDELLTSAFRDFAAHSGPIDDAGAGAVRAGVDAHRRRTRIAVTACGVVLALIVGVGVALARTGPDRLEPTDVPPPSPPDPSSAPARPSASPTPSASSSSQAPAGLRVVDWNNVTLRRTGALPADDPCAAARIEVRDGTGTAPATGARLRLLPDDPPVLRGDLTGDGNEDAIVRFRCTSSGAYEGFLVVTGPAAAPRVLFARYEPDGTVAGFGRDGRVLNVLVQTVAGQSDRRVYRWQAGQLEALGEPTRDGKPTDWTSATLRVPFTGSPALPGSGVTCPGRTLRFTPRGAHGTAEAGGCTYVVVPRENRDVDGDGTLDTLLEFGISPAGVRDRCVVCWLYVLDSRGGSLGFVTTSVAPEPIAGGEAGVSTKDLRFETDGRLTVGSEFITEDGATISGQTRSFRWAGGRFTPSEPALDPAADRAP